MGKILSDGKDVVAEKMLCCWQRRCYVMGKILSDGKDVVVEKMLCGGKDVKILCGGKHAIWWKRFPITRCYVVERISYYPKMFAHNWTFHFQFSVKLSFLLFFS